MQEVYRQHLMQSNVSYNFEQFIQQKIKGEEVELSICCQLTRGPVVLPIRHLVATFTRCIFEMETWLEFFSDYEKKNSGDLNSSFSCPGCKKYTSFKDYGVDFVLYNVLEGMRTYLKNHPEKQIDKSKIVYFSSPINPQYYMLQKIQKTQSSSKIKIVQSTPQRYLIPGIIPINGIQKKYKKENEALNDRQRAISEELAITIVKLQQYLNSKIFKANKQKNINFQQLQAQVQARNDNIKNLFRDKMKLISIGAYSLTKDYVYGFRKVTRENFSQSILIVYYVHYGVWHEFYLTLNGQPYSQKEQALYVKGDSTNQENIIYILGGQMEERFYQSDQFIQISFPNDPFLNNNQATLKSIGNLPEKAYNYMGTCYKGNFYLFYGQKQYRNKNDQIKNELITKAFSFKQGRWTQMNVQLKDRFDGSFFTLTHPQFDKLIVFLGGVAKDPDGLANYRCTQQDKGQIFLCQSEQFLGQPSQEFQINFAGPNYQKSVLSSPIFSVPHYGTKQLILSGEYLRYENMAQREIYTFNYGSGNLERNDYFSLEPPEQILTVQKRLGNSTQQTFTPVQDNEGVRAYGNFYIIHQCEQEISDGSYRAEKTYKVFTQLLRINLTSGLFFTIPYDDHQISLERGKKRIDAMERRDNKYI